VACNGCSLIGRREKREYAVLIDSATGKTVKNSGLKKGTENTVSLTEWIPLLKQSRELTLSIIHNHPNGAPFSLGDIKEFLKYPSIKSMWLPSGKRLYYLEKQDDSVLAYDAILKKVQLAARNIGKTTDNKQNRIEVVHLIYKEVFKHGKIRYERW
jgi:hypothetical protein